MSQFQTGFPQGAYPQMPMMTPYVAPTGTNGSKKVVMGILIFLILTLIIGGIGFAIWHFVFRKKNKEEKETEKETEEEKEETEEEKESETKSDSVTKKDKKTVFIPFPLNYVPGKAIGSCILDTTLEKCQDKCKSNKECKSFDFGIEGTIREGKCCLNNAIDPFKSTKNYINWRRLDI